MNLLNTPEDVNGDLSFSEDRQLSVMLHTGLDDKSLGALAAGYMPPNNASSIDKLITQLIRNTLSENRSAILRKVRPSL